MENIISSKGLDEYEVHTEDRETFLNTLKDSKAYLPEYVYGQLAFVYQEQAVRKYGEKLHEIMGVSKELVENNKSQLILVDIEKTKPYLVADTAWVSIKNQSKVYGEGFDKKLSIRSKTAVLNEVLTENSKLKDCTLVIIDDKIRAIMTGGDDGRTFTAINPIELIDSFEKAMESKSAPVEFKKGIYSYTFIKAVYSITNDQINGLYEKKGYTPMILLQTSETAYSATKLIPCFINKNGSGVVLEQEALTFEHKGNNNIDNIKERIGELFIRQQNFIENIDKYMSIIFKVSDGSWREVIKKLFSKIKTPVKLRKNIEQDIERYITDNSLSEINFFDIFQCFMDLDVNFEQKEDYEIMLGRILSQDIEKIAKEIEQ